MTKNVPAPLTEDEQDQLGKLEEVIRTALRSAVDDLIVARVALVTIKNKRLYKATHSSIAAYALDRFGISESSFYRWIEQGEAVLARQGAPERESAGHLLPPRETLPSQRSLAKAKREAAAAVVDAASEDVTSPRTSKERVERGDSQHGTPIRPGASGGAVATTEKVAEAEPAVPSPARGSTPSRGEEPPPPVASPSNGPLYPQPVTTADVVALFARLETVDDGMLTKAIDGQRLARQGKRLHRLGAPSVSPTKDGGVHRSDCLHPPARRLGSTCSDCGCAVPKDAKWGRRAGRA